MRTEPLIDKKNDDGWGCPESIYKVGGWDRMKIQANQYRTVVKWIRCRKVGVDFAVSKDVV